MKIWNWYENMKLIWKYETAQFDILMFLCIVPTWMFDIFILDAAGMKIHLAGIKPVAKERMGCLVPTWTFAIWRQREWKLVLEKECFGWIATWITKTQREQSRKTFHDSYVNTYSYVTQSDSYFKPWFLCSQNKNTCFMHNRGRIMHNGFSANSV